MFVSLNFLENAWAKPSAKAGTNRRWDFKKVSKENPEVPKMRSVKQAETRPLACDFHFGQLLYRAE